MNELDISKSTRVTLPTINFVEYEKLKGDALAIAETISVIEVTEENVKESKKMLARVNKSVALLNKRRIEIKNEILKPYDEFAEKIKEIETIVKDADEIVRSQVRQMEEAERQAKLIMLEAIWDERIKMYDFAKIMKVSDWLEARHLNKIQTIKKSEEEMVEFLEKCERDIQTLSFMQDSAELIHEYSATKDMGMSIRAVNDRKAQIQEQRELLKEFQDDTDEKPYLFIVNGEKDKKLVELLLKENGIEFILKG